MRPILAAAVLALALLPVAAADPGETRRVCTEVGCVILKDGDGDGGYDWANVAASGSSAATLNANLNRTVLLWELVLTSDELGGHLGEDAAHEVEDATGLHLDVVTLAATGESNLTARDGSPGFHDADVLVTALRTDHETGEQEAVVWRYARVYDADGDGVPDGVETLP